MITSRIRSAPPVALTALLVLVGGCLGIARAAALDTHATRVTLTAVTMTPTSPRLLTEDFSTSFAVEPATIFPTGDGSIVIGKLGKRGHDIAWHKWTASRAWGLAPVWIDNGVPSVAKGTFYRYRGSINASRVRDGRFTRMTVHYRKDGKLKSWSLVLTHVGTPGWTWRTR
jgi:hypothetical protein